MPTSTEAPTVTTSTSLQVHVQPERVELRLGEPVAIEVQIFNGSPIVDEFAVELLGPTYDPLQPDWIAAAPVALPLFPDATGSIAITLLAPAGSLFAAGAHRLGVRVYSTTERQQAVIGEITIAVASQPSMYMHLEPETLNGGRTAELEVQVRNTGNSPLHLVLGADDPANALTFKFGQREVDLPLDTEQFIRLEVAGRRPLIGRTAQRAFSVAATLTDRAAELDVEPVPFGEPARANGIFNQRPWISSGILMVFAVLLPVLAILAAAFIIRPPVEAPVITGDLTFGVDGEVQEVFAREGGTVLTGAPLAKLDETLARLEVNARQVTLREAVVAKEALATQQLIDQATGTIPPAADAPPAEFLTALSEKLLDAQLDALELSRSALTGLADAFAAYCANLAQPLPECPNPNYPLTADTVAALQQDASSLAARVVLDANAKYTAVTVTLQNLQGLRSDVDAQLEASAGEDGGEPATAVSPEDLETALAQQSAVEAEQATADIAKATQAVDEAALACREAIHAIGLTTLRAPFDVLIKAALVTRDIEVKAADVAFQVERTDGRAFGVLSAQRQPAAADIPSDEACPETFAEWQAQDAAAAESPASTPPK